MRKATLALATAAVVVAAAVPASADTIVRVADPAGTFTDSRGNAGYAELRDDGVRACNENEDNPAGDQLTGYIWVDAGGDGNAGHADDDSDPDGVTYGNETVGAGDYDGEGAEDGDPDNGTEGDDCPGENAP